MPQTTSQTQSPTSSANGGDYNAVDPKKDPIAFIYQHRQRLNNMDPDKAVKFVDRMFQRFALPKYQRVNQQRPLDEEELERLRLQFAARMFDLSYDQKTELKDPKVEYGKGAKALASIEGAGAGVLGGIRTIGELADKLNKLGGKLDPRLAGLGELGRTAGKGESRAWEDASRVAPTGASVGAAVGHQIPATIATAGVGGALPTAAKGAGLATKMITGAGRGLAEGTTFEATRPGGDPKSGAVWGGVLGAAFPFLGKLFGLGRKAVSSAPEVAEAVAGKAGTTAEAASGETSTTYKGIADTAAKKKFGKAFKDLTSAEKAQMPEAMKEEIKAQQAVKQAKAKAEKAAAKAAKEAEGVAQRAEKAKAASEKAATQAQKRAGGTEVKVSPESSKAQTAVPSSGVYQKQAVAAQAASENPSIGKTLGSVERRAAEGVSPTGTERRTLPLKNITGPPEEQLRLIHEAQKEVDAATTVEEKTRALHKLNSLKGTEAGFEMASSGGKKMAEDIRLAKAKEGSTPITKVPEGEAGKKVRASGGKPASPAQQAADRERIAAKRELSKKEEFGSALEKHAQQMAGRYTPQSLSLMALPEAEEAIKELPHGEVILRGLQKLRKQGRISDENYFHEIIDWMKGQFEANP